MSDNGNLHGFIKFNISELSTTDIIEYAEVCYVIRSGVMGGTEEETLEVYGVSNYTWTEEDGSTRSMNIDQGTLILEEVNPSVSVGSSNCLNVTDWVRNETRDGRQNVTIGLNLTESSADTSDDYVTFYSKEYATAADRPYLNVTYSSGKTLTLINPTTSSPESVSAFDNITVSFNFTDSGVNQTSGVTMDTVLVGGEEATIVMFGLSRGPQRQRQYVAEITGAYLFHLSRRSNRYDGHIPTLQLHQRRENLHYMPCAARHIVNEWPYRDATVTAVLA